MEPRHMTVKATIRTDLPTKAVDLDEVRTKASDDMVWRLTQTTGVFPADNATKSLPAKRTAPIQVVTFEC